MQSVAVDSRFLTVANAASYAGISRDSVRRLISQKRIASYRPLAGRVLVERAELDKVIESSARVPRCTRGRAAFIGGELEGE